MAIFEGDCIKITPDGAVSTEPGLLIEFSTKGRLFCGPSTIESDGVFESMRPGFPETFGK